MCVKFVAHPSITMDPPMPLKTIVEEVTFPFTTTVPELEGMVSVVVVVVVAVQTPPMHTKSIEGAGPLQATDGVEIGVST